jgi:hypothetical protein
VVLLTTTPFRVREKNPNFLRPAEVQWHQMIVTKNLYFIPGGLGILALCVGLLFYPYNRMTEDDVTVAFSKLVEIPLQSIVLSGGSSSITFDIPNNKQWKHIREEWHQPRYVIGIDPDPARQSHETISLNDLAIGIELSKYGNAIELKPIWPPYVYSSKSKNYCLEFKAIPGDRLMLFVALPKKSYQIPARAELFIINDWPTAKDLIVGADISNNLLFPISKFLIGLGCLLILIAISLRVFGGKRMNPESHPPIVGPWHGLF